MARQITAVGEGLWTQHRLRAPLLQAERLHITLVHIGDYTGLPPDAVARAREAAANLVAYPFEVRFDRGASFRNGPLVLLGEEGDLAPLLAFRQALAHAIACTGLKTKSSLTQFKPHVTLLYERSAILPEQPVKSIGWTATELVLVHSLLGETRHIPLARWPITG